MEGPAMVSTRTMGARRLRRGLLVVAIVLLSTSPATAQDNVAPTVLVLTPARSGIVIGVDTVKVQYWDASGAGSPPLEWRVNGGGVWNVLSASDTNANYDCGTNCAVYEFDLNTTSGGVNPLSLANGSHTLNLRATDAASTPNTGTLDWLFVVSNADPVGPPAHSGASGMLLRRSSGSQLCIDCHNLPTHSSQSTDTGYGNWAVGCLDCHGPHLSRNIFLIRETIATPNSGNKTVRFHIDDRSGGTNPGARCSHDQTTVCANDAQCDALSTGSTCSDDPGDGWYGFLGNRSNPSAQGENSPFDDGICEVCHTQTSHWRNDTSGGDHLHNARVRCLNCHDHGAGFRGAGACLDCHGTDTQGPRRAVLTDFDDLSSGGEPRSHHVGNGGTFMGGVLTSFDCVVCHAEGRVDDGGTPSDPSDDEVKTVGANHGGDGGTTTIDLKDADDWDDATGTGTVYAFDKEDIATNTPGGAVDWNSGNQYWREWTSGVDEAGGATLPASRGLDPFCLTCHDSDGASQSFNSVDGGSATNPFGDGAITNEYDQQDRTSVVDIDSKVTADSNNRDRACNGGSNDGALCAVGADCPGGTCDNQDRFSQNIADPPEGVWSRHAIRGKSASVYAIYQNLPNTSPRTGEFCDDGRNPAPPDPCQSIWEAGFFVERYCDGGTNAGGPCADDGDCPSGVCGGAETDENGNPVWNDTSVMGCADCHTVDGANGSAGNAHGSDSEYLLKDANGGALEGTIDDRPSPDPPGFEKYICYRCHTLAAYQEGSNHTGNASDFEDSVLRTGAARLADPHNQSDRGTIFGIACMNCHGGAADSSTITLAGFGRIHGTSQDFVNGAGGRRQAYRFMNGGGLRFYNPATWSARDSGCYTLGGTGDEWSACSHHSSQRSHQRSLFRTLDY